MKARDKLRLLVLCIALISCATYVSGYAKAKMIFASEIIRHGDRTPYKALPTAPYSWPEDLGQLTALGMQEEYFLGKSMRHVYITQEKLLAENYQADQIYVRSTDIDRTLMSAQSLLLGLYPLGSGPVLANGEFALPNGYQPIPVHSISIKRDTLLLARNVKRTEFNNLVDQYVAITDCWKKQETVLKPKMKKWRKALDMPIKSIYDIPSLGDNLYVRTVHNVPLPSKLSPQEIKEIIYYGSIILAQEYQPKQIGALTGKKLLVAERDNMQKVVNGESSLKFILYSAHDISILAFMSAIGAPLEVDPPYASHLAIQLYQLEKQPEKQSENQAEKNYYYFTIAFNDKPIKIPSCDMTYQCTLTQLNKIIDMLNKVVKVDVKQ